MQPHPRKVVRAVGEWEHTGHRCGIIRHNGTMSHNAMSETQRAEQAFDLHAECCMGKTKRKPHRDAKAVTTAVFQPSTRAVTRGELEALGFG